MPDLYLSGEAFRSAERRKPGVALLTISGGSWAVCPRVGRNGGKPGRLPQMDLF